jgi:hypothetical protein
MDSDGLFAVAFARERAGDCIERHRLLAGGEQVDRPAPSDAPAVEQLLQILRSDGEPQTWVDRMVTEANRRGGLDNITAIVIRIDSVDSDTGEHPAIPAAASQRS